MLALQAEVLELKANPKQAGARATSSRRASIARAAPSRPCWSRKARCASATWWSRASTPGRSAPCSATRARTSPRRGPSTPVEVLGLDGVPDAGEVFNVVTDEKAAKALVEHRRDQRRKKESTGTGAGVAGEHPRQDQGGRGQGGEDRPQGRRAGLGRGGRQRAHQPVHRGGAGQRDLDRASAASPSPTSAWPRPRRRSSSASTSAPRARPSSSPSRRASTSSCTRSSTTPSTT